MTSKKCIIIANGNAPSKRVFRFLQSKGYDLIICADGGANTARHLNIIPRYIIGDLDSITPDTRRYFTGKSEIIQITRQNDTDVEKCIKFALKKGCTDCILLAVTGDRLDHSFCNLGIAIKFSDQIHIRIISEKSILSVAENDVEINTFPGETFSLYAIDDRTTITSKGLMYRLKDTKLPFGKRESTSNVALKEKVALHIKGGKIFIIRDFDTIKKNGLFQ